MTTKTYLTLCAATVVVWPLALLYIPGVANTVELLMLLFLSSTA